MVDLQNVAIKQKLVMYGGKAVDKLEQDMDMSFELFIVTEIKIVIIWVVTLLICRWLSTFGGACCLHP
jgi:hypothetical protein